jgi:hypothetical protein
LSSTVAEETRTTCPSREEEALLGGVADDLPLGEEGEAVVMDSMEPDQAWAVVIRAGDLGSS